MAETTTTTTTPPATTPPPPDYAKEIADLKAQNIAFQTELKKLTTKPPPETDPELIEKARKQKAEDDKKVGDNKAMESALKFGMKAPEWLKTNETLLPKDVKDIFTAADKENYATAVEKDAAIKAGIVQSFFSVQANLDLLTPGLKTNLEDFLKLTKNGKQEKAQQVYDNVFEPAFEMLRRVKKAEALNKGYGDDGDDETQYKNKLIAGSKKHYLGEK